MRIHGIIWSDVGGKTDAWSFARDLSHLGEAFQIAGNEFKYWDKYMIHESLLDDGAVSDCDVLIVHMLSLVRYGGKPSKWDADVCRLVNMFDGPVILFINDQVQFPLIKMSMKEKFGDNRFLRPVYIADDRKELNESYLKSGLEIAGHVRLNQSWPSAWHWLQNEDNKKHLKEEPCVPSHSFIYGGAVRKKDFMKRIDNCFKVFGLDNCVSYSLVAEKWGLKDSGTNWGQKYATVEQLMELNSSCKYSGLPYDKDKDYVTSRCFEQGFADCLVLCDKGYNQEDCGFPVVDYMDPTALAYYRDLPEQDRIRMVKEQHDRLASIDYEGRSRRMIDNMMEEILP